MGPHESVAGWPVAAGPNARITWLGSMVFYHEEADQELRYLKLDIRKSTCQGGGALWSLLSHVRDLPPGDTMEILTDDHMANADIPAWVKKRDWKVTSHKRDGYFKFLIERPLNSSAQA